MNVADDLLAQTIVERGMYDLRTLKDIPSHLRAHREWLRSKVAIPVVRGRPRALVTGFPEFVSDPECRASAGMAPIYTDEQAARLQRLCGDDPSCAPPDRNGHMKRGIELREYDVRSGQVGDCDVCGKRDTVLQGKVELYVDDIPTMRSHFCSCVQSICNKDVALAVAHRGNFLNKSNGNGRH